MTHRVCAIALLFMFVLAARAQAQTFTTLYNFTDGSDGGNPAAGVIEDSAGNIYGTTTQGGRTGCGAFVPFCGVVFELDTDGTEVALYSFYGNGDPDGRNPNTPLVRDSEGNLYGTTPTGGAYGFGIVFKVDTNGDEWVLHSFAGGSDSCDPEQGLLMDKAGNLYGTTQSVNCAGTAYGTIFMIDRKGKYTVLHTFAGPPSDGANPSGGHLLMNAAGDLNGVTSGGGANGYGALYGLSKDGRIAILYSFAGGTTDGCVPYGSVLQDKVGNLYGTTSGCGSSYSGTIWKVDIKRKETILHNFAGGTSDGCNPVGGTTGGLEGLVGVAGCGANGDGALYNLNRSGTFSLVHSFDGSDGSSPAGEVWRTAKGTLVGTTAFGGANNGGTVWEYVP